MKHLKITLSLALMSSLAAMAQKPTVEFNARGIVALSDADMSASAFADGKLLKESGARDILTSIPLPLTDRSQEIGQVVVSNSVTTWAKGIALSPDGRVAFVLESRGQVGDTLKSVKNAELDLPAGSKMFVVDLANPSKPAVKFGAPVGKLPMAIDILQNLIVIVSGETDKEVQLVEVDGTGRPTRIVNTALKMPGVRATDVSWHPGGEFIAVTLDESKSIMLMKARKNPQGKVVAFDPFGKPLAVGTKPGFGKFNADGSVYVVTDVKDRSGKGELFAIQFNTTGEAATAEHKIVSQATVGVLPEHFAISPDGATVVTVNANKTYQSWESGELSRKSSLSLLTLGKDGKLTNVSETEFDGILPENVIFDKTGDNIAVSVYEYFDFGKRNGGIEFFKVTKGGTPALTKSSVKVNVARGCHSIRMIP
jgi:DNA-binding beta-propeller fold protein YncE